MIADEHYMLILDNYASGYDVISISFGSSFDGVGMLQSSSVRLPASALALTQPDDRPPVFGFLQTATKTGAASSASPYSLYVEAGTVVTAVVVPEPSTITLLGFGVFGFAALAIRARQTNGSTPR